MELSRQIGKGRVLWRYDPIVLNDSLIIDFHKLQFERLCQKLAPFTASVTISFVEVQTHQGYSFPDAERYRIKYNIDKTL